MKSDNRGPLAGMLRAAEMLTMGLHLARRFQAATVSQRYSTSLLDTARTWGVAGKA
jgi:hypothetical protein